MSVMGELDVIARYGWRFGEEWCLRELREQKDNVETKRHSADVRGWKRQAREVVVLAGGLNDSGKSAFVAGVVLVQLSLCEKIIDDLL